MDTKHQGNIVLLGERTQTVAEYRMRVADREIDEAQALEIFDEADYCVISSVDEDGMAYGVPISFVMMDGKLYVHTTNTYGHKLDNFRRDSRVSVLAVVDVEACFEDTFMTSRFGSAMMFGHIRRVEEDIEVRKALVALCMKYLPEYKKEIGSAIEREIADTDVWVVEPESITGKAARRKKKTQ